MSHHYKLNILKSGYITNILAIFSKTVSKTLKVHKLNQIQINIVKEYTGTVPVQRIQIIKIAFAVKEYLLK